MQTKLALPKGRLLDETASLLRSAGWGLSGYHQGERSYRPKATRFPELLAKVFHERDIPIQVAVGNYDLGICGRDWVEELLARYPSSALVKVRELGHGYGTLYIAASKSAGSYRVSEIKARRGAVRIASEYPNLAELFAVDLRLRRFIVFPVWGAAEVYPPESTDLALISVAAEEELARYDLVPVSKILTSSAFLIANRDSWESKDMGAVLDSLHDTAAASEPYPPGQHTVKISPTSRRQPVEREKEDTVWLALPDGHQQLPTVDLLGKAGIQITDYPSPAGNRRPGINLDGVKAKVIRPQDMPLQVANGNFDLAITGRDWLREHLYQFPSSPVAELLDLKFGRVRIVAVVSNYQSMTDIEGFRQSNGKRTVPCRVASEYVNIADKYAQDNHLGWYRVVPTWGASEGFLPEDADLLIENAQTGRTLSRHNLKVIDTLFESTACLLGSTVPVSSRSKNERIKSIIATLKGAVED
ncbi:ATP phosphoribosyltransferase [Chloroflexota bacterium]